VLRHTTLAPLAASVLLAAALIVPAAGADSGPLPPVSPPSPIPAVSGVTTCTSPAPSIRTRSGSRLRSEQRVAVCAGTRVHKGAEAVLRRVDA
jgi:hypothetical protein